MVEVTRSWKQRIQPGITLKNGKSFLFSTFLTRGHITQDIRFRHDPDELFAFHNG